MPSLYQDTGPPLLLCGYASVFNVTYRNGSQLERVAPGAFQFPGSVSLDFNHEGRCLASTYGGSLKLWQDHHGLAFEAALRPDWATMSLMHAVHIGTFRGASFRNTGDGKGAVETLEENGRVIHEIRRLNVSEVSLVTSGANPSACVWLGDEAVNELPSEIASARARWRIGRQEQHIAEHRAKARAGKPREVPPAVLARIDQVLAMAGRRT